MRKLECPSCGANLELKEDNRDFAFCEFCGAKITLDDFRSTHHVVDEARLKEAETEQMIRKKQLEWAEKQEAENARKKQLKLKITIITGIVCAVSFLIGYLAKSNFFYLAGAIVFAVGFFATDSSYFRTNPKAGNAIADIGKIRMPDDLKDYWTENYIVIQNALKRVGFTNIKCVPLNDLTTGLLNTPNTVDTITIDGEEYHGDHSAFSPHAEIIITYHSMAEQNARTVISEAGQKIKDHFKGL